MPINRESRIENLWSSVTGATPDTGDFNYGELAINVVDKKVYFKDSTGSLSFLSPQTSSPSSGGAGTNTYAVFTPFYSEPPGLTYPTLDNRNTIAVLDFDSAANEETHFRGMIPHGATFSYLLTNIYWTSTTTGAGGTASWSIAYERMLGDIDSDNFDQSYTGYSYYNPAGASSGVPLLLGITAQNVGALGAGNPFRIRIMRNGASDALDTLINDAELLLVEVRGVT